MSNAVKLAKPTDSPRKTMEGLVVLAVMSLIVGVATGLICGIFRWLLDLAGKWRNEFLIAMHGWEIGGLLCVVVTFAAVIAIAAWMVRRYAPYATGSGIPHVEAVLAGEAPPAPPQLLPVKFVGGLLALGAGLALGREGPSVQMGATISHLIGRAFRLNTQDCLLLLAAGAGAGLSVAFNAPIAGAVFVLEELTRRFDTRTTIVTFGASASAIAVGRLIIGNTTDFHVPPMSSAGFDSLPICLVLGILAGLVGVAYNRAIIGTQAVVNQLNRWPVEARAAVVGGAVGLLAWFAPNLVGGGDVLVQQALTGAVGISALTAIFLLRFVLGPISYAVRTPGGLFAPLLVLGAQGGLIFGRIFQDWFPTLASDPVTYATVGTAAFFAAVVRAPLTGIILVVELTGSYTQLLPMLAACFTAMLVPTLLNNPPIYESLKMKV